MSMLDNAKALAAKAAAAADSPDAQRFAQAALSVAQTQALLGDASPITLTADQIKYMVDRFLGWRLPRDFKPDGGISFDLISAHGPSGTNLFDANQADRMVRYMLEGMPK